MDGKRHPSSAVFAFFFRYLALAERFDISVVTFLHSCLGWRPFANHPDLDVSLPPNEWSGFSSHHGWLSKSRAISSLTESIGVVPHVNRKMADA
jgi:hypothetical protein